MRKIDRVLIGISSSMLFVTGLILFGMIYIFQTFDEFGVVVNPAQPAMQVIHLVFAPLFVFAVGAIFHTHILSGLRKNGTGMRSGLVMSVLLFVMILSGYAVQLVSSSQLRTALSLMHTVSGVLWAGFLVAHVLGERRRSIQTRMRASDMLPNR
jgi:hypothetical protein